MADEDEDVVLTLTHDEALVLFEWLHRNETRAALETIVVDQAELIAVESLSALLEPELVELFAADYLELVDAARTRLRGAGDA